MSLFVAGRPSGQAPFWQEQQNAFQCGALIVVLGVLMSATGACDTDNLGIVHRTSLWLTIVSLVVLQAVLLRDALAHIVVSRIICGLVASGVTVVLTAIELHFLKYTPFLPKQPDPPLEFLLFVLPLAGPVAVLALTLTRESKNRAAIQPRPDTPAATPTDEPQDWPAQAVTRVTAQDHYLHVHTADGTQLVRGRMKDATIRLATERGIQIHRSHWVARDQIVRIVRSGRDYRAILRDGSALPVARSRAAELKTFLKTI